MAARIEPSGWSRNAVGSALAAVLVILAGGIFALRMASPPRNAALLTRALHAVTPGALPEAERETVAFLLLFPFAAAVICFFRVFVGWNSFGTFTPALIGLTFRNASTFGLAAVFLIVVFGAWSVRRRLDRLHLLHVPRTSFMLCLVNCALALFVISSHHLGCSVGKQIHLLPLVILTSMVERLWSVEEDEGRPAAWRTLAGTLIVALVVGLVAGRTWLVNLVLSFPEIVAIPAALLLLAGRYTGLRLTELARFRDLALDQGSSPGMQLWQTRLITCGQSGESIIQRGAMQDRDDLASHAGATTSLNAGRQ